MVLGLIAEPTSDFSALFSREFKLARIFFNSAPSGGVVGGAVVGGAVAGGASVVST